MANSFNLRLKQVNLGVSAFSGRIIAALLAVGVLGMLALWQAQWLPRLAAPQEALTVQRISMPTDDSIVVDIRNSGTDAVTVAQVQVDAAYWTFAIEPSPSIAPAKSATIKIPYEWVPDEPHIITIVTRSGATFEGSIDAPGLSAGR